MIKYGIDPEELKEESSDDETEEFLENVNEDKSVGTKPGRCDNNIKEDGVKQ